MFSLSPYEWCNQPTKTNKKKTESVETFEVIEIVK